MASAFGTSVKYWDPISFKKANIIKIKVMLNVCNSASVTAAGHKSDIDSAVKTQDCFFPNNQQEQEYVHAVAMHMLFNSHAQ